jgi:predicted DNA-binding transcriptional regulator AlpA
VHLLFDSGTCYQPEATFALSSTRFLKDKTLREERYGISSPTLADWRKRKGFPPGIRIGRDRLVLESDVLAWEAKIATAQRVASEVVG